jgi:hypothetical protein
MDVKRKYIEVCGETKKICVIYKIFLYLQNTFTRRRNRLLLGNDRVTATPLDRGDRESEPERLINLPHTAALTPEEMVCRQK